MLTKKEKKELEKLIMIDWWKCTECGKLTNYEATCVYCGTIPLIYSEGFDRYLYLLGRRDSDVNSNSRH